MINVGHKSVTLRTAEASGSLLLRPMTLEHIRSGKLAKGDAINTPQVELLQWIQLLDSQHQELYW